MNHYHNLITERNVHLLEECTDNMKRNLSFLHTSTPPLDDVHRCAYSTCLVSGPVPAISGLLQFQDAVFETVFFQHV